MLEIQCQKMLPTYIFIVTLWSSEELYTKRNALSACSMIEYTKFNRFNRIANEFFK